MISRRQFVAASVAVPVVWAAPQILSVPIASAAEVGSRPPSSPPKKATVNTGVPMMGPPLATGIPAQMPFTGQELKKEAVLGAAALGAGAALVGLTHKPKREPL